MMWKMKKIIFFGLGSIGMKHLGILKDIEKEKKEKFDIYSFQRDKSKENIEGIRFVYGWDEIKKIRPDIAFITNPTDLHIETANLCAEEGMDLFIEKPISTDSKSAMKDIDNLEKKVRDKRLKSYVAYCLRFHPAIKWMKEYLSEKKPLHIRVINSSYLPDWRPGRNHKEIYSSHKNQGGGVILDLSHELDYLSYLFGNISEMKVNSSRISDTTVDSEDFADIIMRFSENNKKNNFISFCNLHLDFMSHDLRREIIVDFENESIVVDLVNNTVTIKKSKTEQKTIRFEKNEMYKEQILFFLGHNANDFKKNMNDISEAKEIFKHILECKRQVK